MMRSGGSGYNAIGGFFNDEWQCLWDTNIATTPQPWRRLHHHLLQFFQISIVYIRTNTRRIC